MLFQVKNTETTGDAKADSHSLMDKFIVITVTCWLVV